MIFILKLIIGAVVAALVLFLLFVAAGVTITIIRMLFAPKPEHEIISTGSTFTDAVRFGKYLESRSNFLLSHDGDLGRSRASAMEEGTSPAMCCFIRIAHLYGCKVKVKEVKK